MDISGNHSERFAESGIKIVIILEHASFPKKKRYFEQNISRNASYYLRILASLQPRL